MARKRQKKETKEKKNSLTKENSEPNGCGRETLLRRVLSVGQLTAGRKKQKTRGGRWKAMVEDGCG